MSRQITLTALAALLMVLLSSITHAQHSAAIPMKPPFSKNAPHPSLQSQLDVCDALDQRLDALDQTIRKSDADPRLTEIEKAVKDLNRASTLSTLLPAIIAAIAAIVGVFVGGLVNDRLQRARLVQEEKAANAKAAHETRLADAKAKQERELAEKQSKLQIGNAVVEWQLKQLYLLYGPVRALLGQSFGLYRQMNMVLQHADSSRFRFVRIPDARGQNAEHGEEFQIRTGTQDWERFRTIMHIDQVYGQGFGVETYFDEIVAIGARTVTIIEQNAGYARPEEQQLMNVFAKYLAHFAVLKHLHGIARTRLGDGRLQVNDSTGEQLKVDVSAVFPIELHDLINQGFKAITEDIAQWREKAIA